MTTTRGMEGGREGEEVRPEVLLKAKVGGVGVEPGKMLHLCFPGEQAIEESARVQAQVELRADA